MNYLKFPLLFIGLAMFFVACDEDDEIIDLPGLPDQIVVSEAGLYPEGVDYSDELGAYIVTSLTTGRVGQIDDDGNYRVLVNDTSIISAIGVLVDDDRKRVLVAISDPGGTPNSSDATAGQTARLGAYDLETGQRIFMTDLAALHNGGPAFANDIAIDSDGNAYVTNSFAPYIYKVDKDGNGSIFANSPLFAAADGAFGLNGIVYNKELLDKDFLIIAKSDEKKLFKINLDEPDKIEEIALDGVLPDAPDGLELESDDELIVVCNAAGKVVLVDGDDDFSTATVEATYTTPAGVFPTTATQRGDEIYVLYAYLGKLFGGDASQATFPIQRVDFD